MDNSAPKRQSSSNKTTEWLEAFVNWTRYDYVAMYDYPTTQQSNAIQRIYLGDMVLINRKSRLEDWCWCQVGHQRGWIYLKDVRFIVARAKSVVPQEPKITPRKPIINTPAEEVSSDEVITSNMTLGDIDMEELEETQPPAPPPAPDPEVSTAKKSMIQRLIKFFKK